MSTKISELPVAQEIVWLDGDDAQAAGLHCDASGFIKVLKPTSNPALGKLRFELGAAIAPAGSFQFDIASADDYIGLCININGAQVVGFVAGRNGGVSGHSILVNTNSADGCIGWSSSAANMGDVAIGRADTALLKLVNAPASEGAGIEFKEMTAPSAGGSNTARLFCRDNGSGKSQLCVIFATGAVQVIATEP